jgi:hypothetical protein
VPPGYGTLRQDDIAIKVGLAAVQVRLLPLDESVIRLLSPDSYRALRDMQEGRREALDAVARRANQRRPSLWFVSFHGLQPESRFDPTAVRITSAGREFRPLGVVPLTPGFGEQRVRQREVQSAILVFEEGINLAQPLVVTIEDVPNESWAGTLRAIERERALVRSRAGKAPTP